MAFAVLSLAFAGVLLLPYLPALAEWLRRTDAGAMPIAESYRETEVDLPSPVGTDVVAADGARVATIASLRTSAGAAVEAVAAGDDLLLGPGSVVAEHAHAGAHLRVGPGCELLGSASSDGAAAVSSGTRFERLHAPALLLGARHAPRPRPLTRSRFSPAERRDASGRYVVEGDLDIPAGATVGGTLVVSGTVRLGEGAHVDGDVRVGRDLVLGPDASVSGHAFAERAIALGLCAAVDGTAVARRRLTLGPHARVGCHDRPATATADVIDAAPGALVHGTLWARVRGAVVSIRNA